MDYLRIDPAIDSDPKLEAAGWWATRVYELLLKVSALRDLRGRFSVEQQDQVWLARRWDAPDNIDPCRVICEGIEKLLQVKALARDQDGTLLIVGWERWYPTPKTGAERTAKWRQGGRDDGDARDVTPSQAVTVTPTPHHSTPQDTGSKNRPTKTERAVRPAAEDATAGLWEAFQDARSALADTGVDGFTPVPTPRLPEAQKPAGWDAWATAAMGEVGPDAVPRLVCAYRTWLRDKRGEWAKKRPVPWPTQVFMSPNVWRSRVPEARGVA